MEMVALKSAPTQLPDSTPATEVQSPQPQISMQQHAHEMLEELPPQNTLEPLSANAQQHSFQASTVEQNKASELPFIDLSDQPTRSIATIGQRNQHARQRLAAASCTGSPANA